jgi:Cu-Zn family superoxide dismutase
VRISKILLAILSLTTPACGGDDAAETPDASASATLSATTGNTATGSAKFTSAGSDVTLSVSIANVAPSSVHAFHVHLNPACGADGMDAGGHWDPTVMMHGRWSATPHHLGDIGNLTADTAGQIAFELTTDLWVIGTGAENDVVGHSVILHADPDDFTTQPTGNAGGRIACGVIQRD